MPFANSDERLIRPAAVAGQFYPRTAEALRGVIEQAFLSPLGPGHLPVALPGASRRILGMVAPHAGYPYSAQAAAWAYAEAAADGRPAAAVILGVNHRGIGAPLAISPATGWETPLGVMPVATALGEKIIAMDAEVAPDARAHALEHSLEVQVPFLQFLYGELPILPLVIGLSATESVIKLGRTLAALAASEDILIIASTDFSHYVSQQRAEQLDRLALSAIEAVDPLGLITTVRQRDITMCGVLPVAAMLTAAAEAGAKTASILHYHTSGDVTGDRQEVVGYAAAVLRR